jgi:chaperonin GroES
MRIKMDFRPLGDRVAVEVFEQEQKTAGGVIIPDTAKEKPAQGKVLAVGRGLLDQAGKVIPMEIKVGDIVMFGKWAGTEIKVKDKTLLIMKESDIMGVCNA